jgi:hypothetical protein
MENILLGKDEDPNGGQWETYDLKPIDYFYPGVHPKRVPRVT